MRVSFKREKPQPRIIYRHDKQDQNVKDFLKMRKIVKKIEKNCGKSMIFGRSKRDFS